MDVHSNVVSLTVLCQRALLNYLEVNDYHSRLINDLCKRVPSPLLEFLLESLLQEKRITDVALSFFLIPDRLQLSMCGSVGIRNATLKQIGFNCPNLVIIILSRSFLTGKF